MNPPPYPDSRRVPLLTDEVALPDIGDVITPLDLADEVVELPELTAVAEPPLDADAITRQVLHDVQRQLDVMLEMRLREALVPTLARMSDLLVNEAKVDIAAALREVVEFAVAQAIARRRGP